MNFRSNILVRRVTLYLQKQFFSANSLHKPRKPANVTSNLIVESGSDVSEQHPNSSSFTVQYLVNSCGIPLKSAISASKRVQLKEEIKPQYDSVVAFLKSNEFSDTHVAKIVEKQPALLSCRVSTTLEPKIKCLVENGVPGSVIPKIFVSDPKIFFRSLDAQLKPVFEFLTEYVSCDEKLLVVIDRGSWILNCNVKNTLRPNVEVLIEQGMPKNRVGDLLVLNPRSLYLVDVERMVNAVKMIRSVGIEPNETMFLHALRVFLSLSNSSWKRKVGIFESMGWSYDEVISTFVRSPHCLTLSEKKLRGAMDFLVNTVKVDPKIVIGYSKILMYSVEKRMAPRYTIWKILKERHLIADKRFVWLLNKSEKVFVESYITRFSDEVPHLLGIYNQSKKLKGVSR